MKKKQRATLKLLVLAQEQSSSLTEIAYNGGAMRKETQLVKFVCSSSLEFLPLPNAFEIMISSKEKGYKPGYITTSKPSPLIETSVTIRENLHVGRRENEGRRRDRRLVERAESDSPECNSNADRGASCCRYLAFIFSVVLLMKHAFDVVYGTDEYPFTIFTVLTLKAIGILLPMLVIIRTIAAIQRSLRYQSLASEEDIFTSSEEEDNGLEEEDQQQQHLA